MVREGVGSICRHRCGKNNWPEKRATVHQMNTVVRNGLSHVLLGGGGRRGFHAPQDCARSTAGGRFVQEAKFRYERGVGVSRLMWIMGSTSK